ncbi:MAG: hypothetical protein CMJ39_00240 [Phycisphaerae bacterium]|nr:hypothetical protein [Phycisphaerae bacterium]
MLEVSAILGVAAVGALWRMAFEQGSMKRGMSALLREVQLLRADVTKDIRQIEATLHDHELRLRDLEHLSPNQRGKK